MHLTDELSMLVRIRIGFQVHEQLRTDRSRAKETRRGRCVSAYKQNGACPRQTARPRIVLGLLTWRFPRTDNWVNSPPPRFSFATLCSVALGERKMES